MPIEAAVVVLAVQGFVRVASASREAYEQLVRDRDVRLPTLRPLAFDPLDSAERFFRRPENRSLVAAGGRHEALWNASAGRAAEGQEIALVEAWRLNRTAADPNERADPVLVAQWAADDLRPPPPQLRIALALAEVALDFAAAAPGVVKTGSAGHRVLEAVALVARRTAQTLPDLNDPENWKAGSSLGGLVEGLLASLLRAGLSVAADQPQLLIKAPHLAAVLGGAAAPLSTAFDAALRNRDWARLAVLERFRDEVLPVVAQGALQALISNRDAFLGDLSAPGPSVGTDSRIVAVVVNATLDRVAQSAAAPAFSLSDVAGIEALKGFARAAAAAVAAHPELLLAGDGPRTRAVQRLMAAVLDRAAAAPRLDRQLLLDVAAESLGEARRVLPLYLRGGTWEDAAQELVLGAMDGLRRGLGGSPPRVLQHLAGRAQLSALAGLVLARIAATPRMVTGGRAGPEIEAVVAAIATAMAGAGADLLEPAGWLVVAQAAAEAAARNPGRLFRLGDDAAAAIGATVIRLVLEQADAAFGQALAGGRPLIPGSLLSGMIATLMAELADRATVQQADLDRLRALLGRLMLPDAGPAALRTEEVRSGLGALARAVLDGRLGDPAQAPAAALRAIIREG